MLFNENSSLEYRGPINKNNYIYEGFWNKQTKLREGFGIEIFYEQNAVTHTLELKHMSLGEFKQDLKHGECAIVYWNGSYFEGTFKNNSISGEGVYYYQNGDVYEGTLQGQNANGKGTIRYKSGSVYTGE